MTSLPARGSVRTVVYGHVGVLRALIAGARAPQVTLSRRPSGYRLEAAPGRVDVYRFRGLVVEAATAAGDDERAGAALAAAVALWRGGGAGGVGRPLGGGAAVRPG